jgi:hypothetical protein
MSKKLCSIALALVLLVTACPFAASANEVVPDEIDASYYLSMYGAYLYSTGTPGKLKLAFQVYATGTMTKVGIYRILLRKSDGTVNQTIWGSTTNGLQAANTWFHTGDYTMTMVSGDTYYCTVTVVAQNSSGGDTRTITTNVITCP